MYDVVVCYLEENYIFQMKYIKGETEFSRDLGLTSFQMIEMCCYLEVRYNMEITLEERIKIITINDLVNILEEKSVKEN